MTVVVEYERVHSLFLELADLKMRAGGQGDEARTRRIEEIRNELISAYLPMAYGLARRFYNRGESAEDLRQVASIGLIKAVDGFAPDRVTEFACYAVPTILGEIKKWFRDKGWSMRIPRRLKDLQLQVRSANEMLFQQLGRAPSEEDIATALGVSSAEVREAMQAALAYHTESLSAPVGRQQDLTYADQLGDEDPGMQLIETRASLRPLIGKLPERQRKILTLRYFREMTQAQIAGEIGISQMHVSRLLRRSLDTLHAGLLTT
jgi:RNA polymerase sigma-B factor